MATSGELLYGEDFEAHPLFHVFFAAIIILITYLSMSPINFKLPKSLQAIIIFVDMALIFLYVNLRTLKIRFMDNQLRVAFGVFGTSIPFSEILHMEPEQPSFWRYGGGLGIRWGWDGSVGYLMNYSKAVRVVRRRGRSIVFSTRNPETVLSIFENEIRKRKFV